MTSTIEELKKQIQHLSVQDRASLVKSIILSLDQEDFEEDEDEIEQAWIKESQRRAEELEKEPSIGRNAEDVFKELRSKFK